MRAPTITAVALTNESGLRVDFEATESGLRLDFVTVDSGLKVVFVDGFFGGATRAFDDPNGPKPAGTESC